MKRTSIFIIIFLCQLHLFSQEISINFDFENAKQTLNLLEKKNINEKELRAFADLEGSKALLRKINENNDIIIEAIKDANQKIFDKKYQNFQYESISRNIKKWREFIADIESEQSSITSELIESYKKYLNPNKKYVFNVFLLMGGNSSGFTLGDGDNLYIGTHLYRQDMKSIYLTCKHELFHNIQSILYNSEPIARKLQEADLAFIYAYGMIKHIFLEGTAEYISSNIDYYEHPDTDKQNHPHIKELYDQAIVNKYRIKGINYLLNSTILDLYKNQDKADAEAIYQLLFDWNWNNPAYYAGEKMISALINDKGEQILMEYLEKDPIYFMSDYINLSRKNEENYPIQFTDEFANMINKIKMQVETK